MRIKICIGDECNDGHGRHEDFELEVNKTPDEMEKAYLASKAKYELNFEEICSGYEDTSISEDQLRIMKEAGLSTDDYIAYGDYSKKYHVDGKDAFIKLLMEFIGKSLDGFEWEIIPPNRLLTFGSCRSFGYGFFFG
jgi:hypothetical protein